MNAPEIWTIQRLITWTTGYFRSHGIDEARLDAELLLGYVLQKPRIYLYTHFDQIMDRAELARYRELIQRRAAGYCTAVLIGKKEFMGIDFVVDEHVLVPRPDTEAWMEKLIQRFRSLPNVTLLDLGTGSGALAVSFLYYCREARAVAVDISAEALAVAQRNAEAAGVADRIIFRKGDFLEAVNTNETFDLIVSNPPYIPTEDIKGLAQEVRREPALALDGGPDGLRFYRILGERAVRYLRPGGILAAEVGIHQAEEVKALFAAGGLSEVQCIRDYGGIDRAVWGKRPAAAALPDDKEGEV